jgi:hypothetical protein
LISVGCGKGLRTGEKEPGHSDMAQAGKKERAPGDAPDLAATADMGPSATSDDMANTAGGDMANTATVDMTPVDLLPEPALQATATIEWSASMTPIPVNGTNSNAVGVSVNPTLTITFNRAITTSSFQMTPAATFKAANAGTTTTVLTLTPVNAALATGYPFHFTISAAASDGSGTVQQPISFTTADSAEVSRVEPDATTWSAVPLSTTLRLVFSEPMNETTTRPVISVVSNGPTPDQPCSSSDWQFSPDKLTAWCTTTLQHDSTYQFSVGNTATSLLGTRLHHFGISFDTVRFPQLTALDILKSPLSHTTESTTNAYEKATLKLHFSVPMSPAITLQLSIDGSPLFHATGSWLDSQTYQYTPTTMYRNPGRGSFFVYWTVSATDATNNHYPLNTLNPQTPTSGNFSGSATHVKMTFPDPSSRIDLLQPITLSFTNDAGNPVAMDTNSVHLSVTASAGGSDAVPVPLRKATWSDNSTMVISPLPVSLPNTWIGFCKTPPVPPPPIVGSGWSCAVKWTIISGVDADQGNTLVQSTQGTVGGTFNTVDIDAVNLTPTEGGGNGMCQDQAGTGNCGGDDPYVGSNGFNDQVVFMGFNVRLPTRFYGGLLNVHVSQVSSGNGNERYQIQSISNLNLLDPNNGTNNAVYRAPMNTTFTPPELASHTDPDPAQGQIFDVSGSAQYWTNGAAEFRVKQYQFGGNSVGLQIAGTAQNHLPWPQLTVYFTP